MPRLFARRSPARTSGGEHVFKDDRGRLGSGTPMRRDTPEGALVHRPGRVWRSTVPSHGRLP